MKLDNIIKELGLTPVVLENESCTEVTSVYCGDLLSDVIAHVQPDALWFTIQGHVNIIAIAQLRDIAGIVLVNGSKAEDQAIDKAREQGVNLCMSNETSAALCMKLAGKL